MNNMAHKKVFPPSTKNLVATELEVKLVQHLANGQTVAEIAEEIDFNRRTLEAKVMQIKAKYGCNTLSGLCALFFRNNLID